MRTAACLWMLAALAHSAIIYFVTLRCWAGPGEGGQKVAFADGHDLKQTLTRAKFESLNDASCESCLENVKAVLKDGAIRRKKVSATLSTPDTAPPAMVKALNSDGDALDPDAERVEQVRPLSTLRVARDADEEAEQGATSRGCGRGGAVAK